MYHGNLVLDCQVPPKLLERCPRKDDREFTHMRYTAATCDVRQGSAFLICACDLELPTFLWTFGHFTHMPRLDQLRAQPDEFLNEQYALRQILYQTPRRTELFIVLTMYNVRFRFIEPSVTDSAVLTPSQTQRLCRKTKSCSAARCTVS